MQGIRNRSEKNRALGPAQVEVRPASKPSRGNGRHGSAGRKKALSRWDRPTPILAVLCCLAMQYASEKGCCEPIICRATRTARPGREAWFVTRSPQKYGASRRILSYQSAIRSCCLSGSFDRVGCASFEVLQWRPQTQRLSEEGYWLSMPRCYPHEGLFADGCAYHDQCHC